MSFFKFGNVTINSKDFYKSKKVIDIYSLDVNDIVVSDPISANGGHDKKYVIGYQCDGMVKALLIKTPKDIYSNGVCRYNENSKYQMGFNLEEQPSWRLRYEKIWSKIEHELGYTLTVDPIKNDCYLNAKLRYYNDHILTHFHGGEIPYEMVCQTYSVLCINSVYNQSKNYYPQVYIEECKYRKVERLKDCCLLSDSDSEGDGDEGWNMIYN